MPHGILADPFLGIDDQQCHLCPGNQRVWGSRNPSYTGTYVFENDFPALLTESEPSSGPFVHFCAAVP